tara:strand:+ start:3485 stop:3640 length:156 start_codon:yes stop_codon:yes gene_type:complete
VTGKYYTNKKSKNQKDAGLGNLVSPFYKKCPSAKQTKIKKPQKTKQKRIFS